MNGPSSRAGEMETKPQERSRKPRADAQRNREDRKSTRLNSSHSQISYAVFCLKKKKKKKISNHYQNNHSRRPKQKFNVYHLIPHRPQPKLVGKLDKPDTAARLKQHTY